jgi:hypothetical protein
MLRGPLRVHLQNLDCRATKSQTQSSPLSYQGETCRPETRLVESGVLNPSYTGVSKQRYQRSLIRDRLMSMVDRMLEPLAVARCLVMIVGAGVREDTDPRGHGTMRNGVQSGLPQRHVASAPIHLAPSSQARGRRLSAGVYAQLAVAPDMLQPTPDVLSWGSDRDRHPRRCYSHNLRS